MAPSNFKMSENPCIKRRCGRGHFGRSHLFGSKNPLIPVPSYNSKNIVFRWKTVCFLIITPPKTSQNSLKTGTVRFCSIVRIPQRGARKVYRSHPNSPLVFSSLFLFFTFGSDILGRFLVRFFLEVLQTRQCKFFFMYLNGLPLASHMKMNGLT